jgi:SAM-dependent methyltransferase
MTRPDVSVSAHVKHRREALEHLGAQRRVDTSDRERERIHATIRMIPADIRSVLDVGCGDGRLFHRLPPGIEAVALDVSYASVRNVRGRALCATSVDLPFADRSFDLVLCCETIEHLPDDVFQRTLDELARVSRRSILITVPFEEDLRLHLTRCRDCGAIFHVWGHCRRFTSRQLDDLFPGFSVTKTTYAGKPDPYQLGIVAGLNQKFGNRWADWEKTTMCPECGSTTGRRSPRNIVTIACGVVNRITARFVPTRRRNWILKLYDRRGDGLARRRG